MEAVHDDGEVSDDEIGDGEVGDADGEVGDDQIGDGEAGGDRSGARINMVVNTKDISVSLNHVHSPSLATHSMLLSHVPA